MVQNSIFLNRQDKISMPLKDIKAAPFMVQISPKPFHSLEPQNHMTFNSSQRFATHPAINLSIFFTLELQLPLFNSSIYTKSESNIQTSYSETIVYNKENGGEVANFSNAVIKWEPRVQCVLF